MEAGETAHTKRQGHMINKKGRFVMFPIETISAKMLVSYYKSHVKGAVNVPYGELENGYAFPKEKMLVFYCDRGGASMVAAREFVRRGYKTRSVIGGFAAYRGRNLVISR